MKFPLTIRHRKAEAKIYGKSESYPFYRLSYYVAGVRRVHSFAVYGEARSEAERIVRELASGSQAAALSSTQSRDALAALERLQGYCASTGRRVSLLGAISEYAEAAAKLKGCSLGEAVEGYLSNVASVKLKDITEAVEQFIQSRQHRTVAEEGKRPQLSAGYAYNVALWLREFARTFPGTAVGDLTKDHLNAYIGNHRKLSAKTRNERRNVVRMFLKWSVRHDYLSQTSRLLEADGMAPEQAEPAEIEFYSPAELRALLEGADSQLRPVIALCALAGARLQEAVRLTWQDVFRVPGHVEISTAKSKTRSRRLLETCPVLRQWLAPYHDSSGPLWTKSMAMFHEAFANLRESLEIPARRNGLRHGFVTYHFALHQNENATSALAGNSPAMIHAHYKGLATKAEAEKWFAVTPPDSATNVIPLPAASRKPAH
jgi:integrase